MQANVDGQIEFGIAMSVRWMGATKGDGGAYPMAAASGEIMSSRRKTYMVQKERVIIHSIGKMIEVMCMWRAIWEDLSVLKRGDIHPPLTLAPLEDGAKQTKGHEDNGYQSRDHGQKLAVVAKGAAD